MGTCGRMGEGAGVYSTGCSSTGSSVCSTTGSTWPPGVTGPGGGGGGVTEGVFFIIKITKTVVINTNNDIPP